MTSFQRDAQKTLMLYACGPVLLFLVLGIVLIAASWQHYVVTRSDDVRMAATGRMEVWLSLYDEATAAVVAEDAETHGGLVPALRNDANARAELSSKLYRAANESRSGALFFLLDDERRIVLGSWKYLPASLDQTPADLGYLSRLHRAEAERLDEWIDGVSETAPDLAIGRRLSQGMVFFLLPGRFLMQELYSPYLDIVVTDEYDNVVLATGGRYLETDGRAPRKLAAPFHMTRGLATSAGERFYVTSDVLSTGWRVTTALPVSDLLTRYAMGMGSFFVVLLIFLPLLWQSARREGDARARAVHEQAALTDWSMEDAMKQPYVADVLMAIQKRYRERLSIEILAEEAGVSTSYLSRKLKETTGHTFSGLLARYRITQSLPLLKGGRLRVYEVAEVAGFADYKTFSQVFKKYLHTSPRTWLSQKGEAHETI